MNEQMNFSFQRDGAQVMKGDTQKFIKYFSIKILCWGNSADGWMDDWNIWKSNGEYSKGRMYVMSSWHMYRCVRGVSAYDNN